MPLGTLKGEAVAMALLLDISSPYSNCIEYAQSLIVHHLS